MKTISANSKKGLNLINNYNNSDNYSLADCYSRFSSEKSRAEYFCRQRCQDENGNGFKVISFNTFGFSVAWMVAEGLRVKTPCNSYIVK